MFIVILDISLVSNNHYDKKHFFYFPPLKNILILIILQVEHQWDMEDRWEIKVLTIPNSTFILILHLWAGYKYKQCKKSDYLLFKLYYIFFYYWLNDTIKVYHHYGRESDDSIQQWLREGESPGDRAVVKGYFSKQIILK